MTTFAPKIPPAINTTGTKTDCIPTANPAIAFVALPVLEASPMKGIAFT